MTGFYVSVKDGDMTGLLLGPFEEREYAERWVHAVKRQARTVDPWSAFYAYGTARVVADTLPPGRLNEELLGTDMPWPLCCREPGFCSHPDSP